MPLFVKLGTLKADIKDADLQTMDNKFVRWLKDIAATGKYITSGGIETRSNGMTVLEADSKEDAMRLFEEDPFSKHLSSWHVHQWNIVNTKKKK